MPATQTLSILLCSVLISASMVARAGGPLILQGPNGHTPVTYPNPAVTLHVEGGDLGAISNADADTLVQQSIDLWNNVPTSTIDLSLNETALSFDINLSNYTMYLPSGNNLNENDNLNPIVYDANGEIIDAFFGAGQSDTTIGVAASIFTSNADFVEGYAVINGKNNSLTTTEFKILIAHELAHFFGLDHTQTNINNSESMVPPTICGTAPLSSYAVMYPFVCRNVESLHADDISTVSSLYPSTAFNSSFGTIQGRFVDESGAAILGANIWAENTTTGDAISVVSDYLTQGNGFYKLTLPPGNYTLHANSINPLFNGGSGIGPYSVSILDASFRNPHPITPVTYKGTSGSTDQTITVSAGQTKNIDFSLAGLDVTAASSASGEDSVSDLFGGVSRLGLLLLLLPLIARRMMLSRR